jgi:hypothetical protein
MTAMPYLRNTLRALIDGAIGGDVIADTDGGFVSIMAKKNPHIRQDIPAAFEMYTLLSHFLDSLPVHPQLEPSANLANPAIFFDQDGGRVLALIKIPAQQMELIAYWLSEGLRSETVKRMPGMLALPFSVEQHDGVAHLIPEWFGAFYVDGNPEHCIPILALRSITADDRFGDWVTVALQRMEHFGLPCTSATNAVRHETEKSHNHRT